MDRSDKTPLDAMIREVQEEFQVQLGEVIEWRRYEWEDKNETVFIQKPSLIIPEEIDLQEGQEIRFLSPQEVMNTDLAFHDNDIMRDYFNER